jgi:ribonuclease E
MEYGSNVRKVEKAMKDALRNDRARIQVGRISGFGLMEMSRQRLRTGVLEATTRQCPHCDGTGLVRTASSAGLSALRLIEDEAAKGKGTTITLYASTEAAIYLLNAKRADLAEIEERYGVVVEVLPEGEEEGAKMRVASTGPRPASTPKFEPIVEEKDEDVDLIEEDEDEEEVEDHGTEEGRGKRRRRRRGGRGRNREREAVDDRGEDEVGESAEAEAETEGEPSAESGEERPKKRRRRGGRRRNKRREGGDDGAGEQAEDMGEDVAEAAEAPAPADEVSAVEERSVVVDAVEEGEAPKRRSRRRKAVEEATEAAPVGEDEPSKMAPTGEEAPVIETEAKPKRRSRSKKTAEAEAVGETPAEPAAEEKPKRVRRKKPASNEEVGTDAEAAPAPQPEPAPSAANDANGGQDSAEIDAAPPRRGWWQRTFGE